MWCFANKTNSLCLVMNRCGNVAAILELDENLKRDFTIFEAAPNVSILLSLMHANVHVFKANPHYKCKKHCAFSMHF